MSSSSLYVPEMIRSSSTLTIQGASTNLNTTGNAINISAGTGTTGGELNLIPVANDNPYNINITSGAGSTKGGDIYIKGGTTQIETLNLSCTDYNLSQYRCANVSYGLSYGNGIFLTFDYGVGTSKFYYSSNGYTWNHITVDTFANKRWAVSWVPTANLFIAIETILGGLGKGIYSSNGLSWTTFGISMSDFSGAHVAYTSTTNTSIGFITVKDNTSTWLKTIDGINWVSGTIPNTVASNMYWSCLTWSSELNGVLLLNGRPYNLTTSYINTIYTYDGTTWTKYTFSDIAANATSTPKIAYKPGLSIITNYQDDRYSYSYNLTTWVNVPTALYLYSYALSLYESSSNCFYMISVHPINPPNGLSRYFSRSSDGINWTTFLFVSTDTNATNILQHIIYVPELKKFCCTIRYYSSAIIEIAMVPKNDKIGDVTFNGTSYNEGTMYALNSSVNTGNSPDLAVFVYGNGKFIQTDNTYAGSYSSNAITWTNMTMSPLLRSGMYITVKWVSTANKFIALLREASTGVYSNDGITWTDFSTGLSTGVWVSCVSPIWGYTAIGSRYGGQMRSLDGITWSNSSTSQVPSDYVWKGIMWNSNNNTMLAIGRIFPDASNMCVIITTDGLNWTTNYILTNIVHTFESFDYSPLLSLYLSHAYLANVILKSTDNGLSWFTVVSSYNIWGITLWSPEYSIFVTNIISSNSTKELIYSYNGITWYTGNYNSGTTTENRLFTYVPNTKTFYVLAGNKTTLLTFFNGTFLTSTGSSGVASSTILEANKINLLGTLINFNSTTTIHSDVVITSYSSLIVGTQINLRNNLQSNVALCAFSNPIKATINPATAMSEIYDVIYCNELGKFIAVGNSPAVIKYSTIGEEWITTSGFGAVGFLGVCWSHHQSKFICSVQGTTSVTSTDGLTWAIHTPSPAINSAFRHIVWCPKFGVYYAPTYSGGASIYYSKDAYRWESFSATNRNYVRSAYSKERNLICTISYSGDIIYSHTGITATSTVGYVANQERLGICWAPELDRFVMSFRNSAIVTPFTTYIARTLPGSPNTWQYDSDRLSDGYPSRIEWSSPLGICLVSVEPSNNFFYSYDTLNWNVSPAFNVGDSVYMKGLCYSHNLKSFLATEYFGQDMTLKSNGNIIKQGSEYFLQDTTIGTPGFTDVNLNGYTVKIGDSSNNIYIGNNASKIYIGEQDYSGHKQWFFAKIDPTANGGTTNVSNNAWSALVYMKYGIRSTLPYYMGSTFIDNGYYPELGVLYAPNSGMYLIIINLLGSSDGGAASGVKIRTLVNGRETSFSEQGKGRPAVTLYTNNNISCIYLVKGSKLEIQFYNMHISPSNAYGSVKNNDHSYIYIVKL